jgi:hypothetical protein
MILQFNIKQYSQMMYNPTCVPEKTDILKFFKDLSRVKEFKQSAGDKLDNNMIMQYILLMYDKNSPYRKKYSDVLKRKIEVAHDVQFETESGGVFVSVVEDFLRGNNVIVNKKIVQYVMLHRSYKYSYQVSVEASYAALMLEIQGGETKNFSKLAVLRDELEENLLELLNQDGNPYLKGEILRYLEDDRLQLRPEDIAKKAQEAKG